MGHIPVCRMPNPKYPEFDCWIFNSNEQFEKDLTKVLGGKEYGK